MGAARKLPKGYRMSGGVPTFDIPNVPEEERIPINQVQTNDFRRQQVNQLNNQLKLRWKRNRRRGVAPRIEFVPRPDNPWRDRYLLCGDCERRADLHAWPPRPDCNCSTLLELDMTAPFSRDNVMATSCEIVQMIREDVRVRKLPDGSYRRVEGKDIPGSFPIQVCPVCRKTSLEEGRRFRRCLTCHGVAYCSDECYGKHRMKHRASCTIPELPYREEWGIRKPLRRMRNEIYPLIHKWAIREPAKHRIAWLPPVEHQQKLLDNREPKRPMLPGFSGSARRLLPMDPARSLEIEGGKMALAATPRRVRLQRTELMRSEEPDPMQLLNLGMTREEFLEKQAKVVAQVEREDAEASLAIVQSEAEALDALADIDEASNSGPVALSAEAVRRVEEAAADAPDEPVDPNVRPPWEVAADEEAKRLGGRREWVKKQVAPKGMPPDEEKKDGVVYKTSHVRERAKRRGLQLSEEALQRLEEAAAIGGGEIEPQDYNEPQYKHMI